MCPTILLLVLFGLYGTQELPTTSPLGASSSGYFAAPTPIQPSATRVEGKMLYAPTPEAGDCEGPLCVTCVGKNCEWVAGRAYCRCEAGVTQNGGTYCVAGGGTCISVMR